MNTAIKNKFYVYFLLNPLKSGEYIYDNLNFNFEPFYVGKGSGRRSNDHLCKCNIKKCLKSNIIKKIRKADKEPIVFCYLSDLNEQQAFDEEIKLIKLIGRRNLKLGPLANLTDGGEGTSGHIVSDEAKEVRRINSTGNKNMVGRKHSEETKRKIGLKSASRKHTKETKNKIGIKSTGRKHKEESKLKIAQANYKSVLQYDLEWNFIQEFEAISIASEKLNICRGSIQKCVLGIRNKAGNFKFKYK